MERVIAWCRDQSVTLNRQIINGMVGAYVKLFEPT